LTNLYRFLLRRRFDMRISPDDRVLIVTRSINDLLYERSQSLLTLPYARRRFKGLNHWRNATDYLHLLFEFPVDWIINYDEDCFIFDNSRLENLFEYMKNNDYDFCGIPDGGVCVHRFHNPLVPNPFFNIFNVAKIRPKFRAAESVYINQCRHSSELEKYAPLHLLKEDHKWAYDNFECFYGVFFWLLKNEFKPLYLSSTEIEDGLTSELRDHEDVPFLFHTWFARSYEVDKGHHDRIDRAYEMAVERGKRIEE
jgi:hypothetical protein